jgi:uncharacterized membrane-anchored protein YjiN (DUF445 family)
MNRSTSLHKFKRTIDRTRNYERKTDKFAHILYRFVPKTLFNSKNILTKVFTNGFAILIAKVISLIEYVELYFDINDDTKTKH